MRNMYGITGIRILMTRDIEEANRLLQEYDGNVIDIQCTDEFFHIIIKEVE